MNTFSVLLLHCNVAPSLYSESVFELLLLEPVLPELEPLELDSLPLSTSLLLLEPSATFGLVGPDESSSLHAASTRNRQMIAAVTKFPRNDNFILHPPNIFHPNPLKLQHYFLRFRNFASTSAFARSSSAKNGDGERSLGKRDESIV
jgi:hypothetical protein